MDKIIISVGGDQSPIKAVDLAVRSFEDQFKKLKEESTDPNWQLWTITNSTSTVNHLNRNWVVINTTIVSNVHID